MKRTPISLSALLEEITGKYIMNGNYHTYHFFDISDYPKYDIDIDLNYQTNQIDISKPTLKNIGVRLVVCFAGYVFFVR